MSAAAILETVCNQGLELRVEGDDLVCRGPLSLLTPELVEHLRTHKPEIVRLVAPSPFQQLCSEWRDANAAARAAFAEHNVEPDRDTLDAAALLEFEFASDWRARRGVSEADARALLEAVYRRWMESRVEDGRAVVRPRYEQGAGGRAMPPQIPPRPTRCVGVDP